MFFSKKEVRELRKFADVNKRIVFYDPNVIKYETSMETWRINNEGSNCK